MALQADGHIVEFAGFRFPANGLTFSPSFGDVVTRTGRLPGLDGGFDEYGTGQAPSEVGNVTMSFTLIAADRDEMQELRDEVLALKRLGKQQLKWKPFGFTEFRFCYARINNIRPPQTPSAHTDLWQTISINFQVSDPRWYSYPHEVWYLNGGEILNDGLVLGGYAAVQIYKEPDLNATLTIEGTADTFPIFVFAPNESGATCVNPELCRVVQGVTVDRFKWVGTLEYGDSLVVDCRRYRVKVLRDGHGEKEGIGTFTAMRAEFMRLAPGENILLFKGTITPTVEPGALDLTIRYWEAWR